MTVTRRDVWDLGDDADPWRDPALLAYAKAVGAMQQLPATSPLSWINQANIHGIFPPGDPTFLQNQCQHACWFFLPWHRMYLLRFETIVRAQMEASEGANWGLPFWNYSDDPTHSALPPAFRQPQLPDSSPNPLFVTARRTTPWDVNGGDEQPPQFVDLTAAMAPAVFAAAPPDGFGGDRTSPLFHHEGFGPMGPLEGTPHGAVHGWVGGDSGLMSYFETAAQDPIFWLHHSNIDRLWEVWLRDGHANSDDDDWLNFTFELYDLDGDRATLAVNDVLDIEQLGYTYAGVPVAAVATLQSDSGASMRDDRPEPELIGATDRPVVLADAATEATNVELRPAERPDHAGLLADDAQASTYLSIDDIEGETYPGLLYDVYINVPGPEAATPDSPHHVGVLSFFGIETTKPDDAREETPHRLGYVFDITDTVKQLSAEGNWKPEELQVTFAPAGVTPETKLDFTPAPVRIGRVSVFVR